MRVHEQNGNLLVDRQLVTTNITIFLNTNFMQYSTALTLWFICVCLLVYSAVSVAPDMVAWEQTTSEGNSLPAAF